MDLTKGLQLLVVVCLRDLRRPQDQGQAPPGYHQTKAVPDIVLSWETPAFRTIISSEIYHRGVSCRLRFHGDVQRISLSALTSGLDSTI